MLDKSWIDELNAHRFPIHKREEDSTTWISNDVEWFTEIYVLNEILKQCNRIIIDVTVAI